MIRPAVAVRATLATPRPPGPEAGLTRIAWRLKQLRLSWGAQASGQTRDISWPAKPSPRTFRSFARDSQGSGAHLPVRRSHQGANRLSTEALTERICSGDAGQIRERL